MLGGTGTTVGTQMRLWTSGIVSKHTIDQLVDDLNSVTSVEQVNHLQTRSADPPAIVQLVGDLAQWVDPLKLAASIFLAQLAKEAAKDVWKNKLVIAKVLKEQACKPLKIVASAIAAAKRTTDSAEFSVTIGLSVPDDLFGTTLPIYENDEELIAILVARFVDQLMTVEAIVRKEMDGPNRPVGQVSLLLQPDGSMLLRWMGAQDLDIHEQVVKRTTGAT
jgi:hypothetical protein